MTPEYEHLVKWGALTMFGGGSDTVSSSLCLHVLMTYQHAVRVIVSDILSSHDPLSSCAS